MATATPTRTLADVYRERLEAADPSDKLYSAICTAIGDMTAPYYGTEDLRPSEIEWLDDPEFGVFHRGLDPQTPVIQAYKNYIAMLKSRVEATEQKLTVAKTLKVIEGGGR